MRSPFAAAVIALGDELARVNRLIDESVDRETVKRLNQEIRNAKKRQTELEGMLCASEPVDTRSLERELESLRRQLDKSRRDYVRYVGIVREQNEELRVIRRTIHFPRCWDPEIFPTLTDAIQELATICPVCNKPHG